MRNASLVLALALGIAACSKRPPFSPLIAPEPGPHEHFDLLIDLRGLRATDLAPGASPAKPRIDGDKAVRVSDFLATFTNQAAPEPTGREIIKRLQEAGFTTELAVEDGPAGDAFTQTAKYLTAGSRGTLAIRCAATANPNVLHITCRVEESLR